MGKKRIIQKSQEELLKEKENIESKMKREVKFTTPLKTREGNIYIASSYNNTLMTLTDLQGNTLTWVSAGSIGFKGTKKATAFAASKVAGAICLAAEKLKIEKINVFIKGVSSGRESAIRSLASHGLKIISIKDITPIPHNGCKPPKARRA